MFINFFQLPSYLLLRVFCKYLKKFSRRILCANISRLAFLSLCYHKFRWARLKMKEGFFLVCVLKKIMSSTFLMFFDFNYRLSRFGLIKNISRKCFHLLLNIWKCISFCYHGFIFFLLISLWQLRLCWEIFKQKN